MRRVVACIVLVGFMASQAVGWSPAGHKIVASLAYAQLSPAERSALVRWLENHPRYAEEIAPKMPDEIAAQGEAARGEWLFQYASVWPDTTRDYTGELAARFNRGAWHYINLPLFLSDADRAALADRLQINLTLDAPAEPEETMNVVQALRFARKTLADPAASDEQKGLMLSWLIHTVGDLHQPNHSTAFFSQKKFSQGDRGGNLIFTEPQMNLHRLWDYLPGAEVDYAEACALTAKLKQHPQFATLGAAAAQQLDEKIWLDESHELCDTVVYAPEVRSYLRLAENASGDDLPPLKLSPEYLAAGQAAADERLIQAGHRLAAVLKSLVAEQ